MTETQSAALTERGKRIAARDAHVKSLMPKKPTIHVEPTKDDYRKYSASERQGVPDRKRIGRVAARPLHETSHRGWLDQSRQA